MSDSKISLGNISQRKQWSCLRDGCESKCGTDKCDRLVKYLKLIKHKKQDYLL